MGLTRRAERGILLLERAGHAYTREVAPCRLARAPLPREAEVSRCLVVVAMVCLILALSTGAWASASLLGPSGLLLIPTADSLGMAQWNVGGSILTEDGLDLNAVYANYGISNGFEIGAARVSPEHQDSETLLNVKYRLPQPVPVKLDWAVGMADITDQLDRTTYVVASHTFGAGLIPKNNLLSAPRLHLGIGNGQLDGLFGGVSATLGNHVDVMAEYDGSHLNLGARLPLAHHLDVTAAALDGLSDFGVGLTLSSPW